MTSTIKKNATELQQRFRQRIKNSEERRIGDVCTNALMPRFHGEHQTELLTAALDRFGIVGILLTFIDDDGVETLFDGHGRGSIDTDETWMIAQTDLSRTEVDELVIFYDPIASLAETDREILSKLVQDYEGGDAVLEEMVREQAEDVGVLDLDAPDFKEYDESVVDDVQYIECPHCKESFPK